MLFVAPLTSFHGQGAVSIHAKRVLETKFELMIVNSFSESSKMFNQFLVCCRIIANCRDFKYIYFTPSRNLASSIRDFLLLLFVKKDAIIVGHLHGSDLLSFLRNGTIYHKYLFYLYKLRLSKLIVLSETHPKYALGMGFDRYKIINNPVEIDLDVFKGIDVQKSTEIKFCTMSNPIKSKGLEEAIIFIAKRFDKYNWHLDIVGWTKNDYEKTYSKRINHELLKNLTFHGRKESFEKYKVLLSSSYFVFLSYYKSEAQPLVIYEALLCGCKIIISDFKMLKDFKKHDNVYMEYEINTEDQISDFIQRDFIYDKSLRKDLSLQNFYKNLADAYI